jgi:acetolactate synthase-1/2/3 large subunit
MDLSRPDLDWIKLAQGLGVDAARAEDTDAFINLFSRALKAPGPHLIEARL